MVKNLPAMQETWVLFPELEDNMREGMAMHSSILAWRIPWTEEPSWLQAMRAQTLDMTEQLNMQNVEATQVSTNG